MRCHGASCSILTTPRTRYTAASSSRCSTRMEPALGLDPRDSRCFLPIHIYEATTGKPVAIILRAGKTPDGAEVALVLRHVIGHIRARWPAVEIVVRVTAITAGPKRWR